MRFRSLSGDTTLLSPRWSTGDRSVGGRRVALHAGTWRIAPLYGDADGDGTLTPSDAAMILEYVVGTIDSLSRSMMDVTRDGPLTPEDASVVLAKAAKPPQAVAAPAAVPETASFLPYNGGWQLVLPDSVIARSGRLRVGLLSERPLTISGPRAYASRYERGVLDIAFVGPSLQEDYLVRVSDCGMPQVLSLVINGDTVRNVSVAIEKKLALLQNYPNPFNVATNIGYVLPRASHVNLSVFDIAGRRIRTLVQAHEDAGLQRTAWDGTDDLGRTVSPGVFLYRLETSDGTLVRRMVMAR